jgi:hypothetical protein
MSELPQNFDLLAAGEDQIRLGAPAQRHCG